MRIIGGEARGRPLRAPAGSRTRPTTDRVREALYSIVCSRIALADRAVLDLFAGSGALGLEALSRGARAVVAVESSGACVKVIADNATRLGWRDRCKVVRARVRPALERLAARGQRFDLVLADPPYDLDPHPVIEQVDRLDLLEAGGMIVLEHASARRVEQRCGRLDREVSRTYGDSALSVFRRPAAGDAAAGSAEEVEPGCPS